MAILGIFFFFLNIGIKTVQIFFYIYKIKTFDFCGGILFFFFSSFLFLTGVKRAWEGQEAVNVCSLLGSGRTSRGQCELVAAPPSQDEWKRKLLILNSDSEKRNTWEREDLAVLWGGCQDKEEGKIPFWVDS